MSQKVLSPNTVYLTYRNATGAEYASGEEIEISFKLNNSDYLRRMFDQGREDTFKCAYIPTDEHNFDTFKTDKCTTKVINADNVVVYDSKARKTAAERRATTGLDGPSAYELMRRSRELNVECRCQHRSYFTVVEDLPVEGPSGRPLPEYLDELPAFNDWASLIALSMVLVGLVSCLLFARGLENKDNAALKLMEEADELHEQTALPKRLEAA